MNWMKAALAAGSAMLVEACASPSHEISAAHVSPTAYRGLDCTQVHAEMNTNTCQATPTLAH